MWFDRLVQGAIDTLLMVGVSSLIALLVGIPLAVFLVTSDKDGIYQAPALNRVLGAFVNLFRSIPFLILMVALIPFQGDSGVHGQFQVIGGNVGLGAFELHRLFLAFINARTIPRSPGDCERRRVIQSLNGRSRVAANGFVPMRMPAHRLYP